VEVKKSPLQLPFFAALSGPSRPFVDKEKLTLPFFAAPYRKDRIPILQISAKTNVNEP